MSWPHILLFFSPFIAFDIAAHLRKHTPNKQRSKS